MSTETTCGLCFHSAPTENGVVTRTSVPPFFGFVRLFVRPFVRSASKMIVLMPRLRKRPRRGADRDRGGWKEGRKVAAISFSHAVLR